MVLFFTAYWGGIRKLWVVNKFSLKLLFYTLRLYDFHSIISLEEILFGALISFTAQRGTDPYAVCFYIKNAKRCNSHGLIKRVVQLASSCSPHFIMFGGWCKACLLFIMVDRIADCNEEQTTPCCLPKFG